MRMRRSFFTPYLSAILLLASTIRLSAHCVPWGDNFETWLDGLWTASAATSQSIGGGINGSNAAFIDNADNLTLSINLGLYDGSANMELSFWYRNTNNFETNDYLYVEINRNGAGWCSLKRLLVPSKTLNLSDFI